MRAPNGELERRVTLPRRAGALRLNLTAELRPRRLIARRLLTRVQDTSTRLTVLYAGLFGAVLLVLAVAVFLAISSAAQRQVRNELAATGTVFDRVWSLRSEQLREGASLLSRDFGFREAVATQDGPPSFGAR